jgi:hypothetical protein
MWATGMHGPLQSFGDRRNVANCREVWGYSLIIVVSRLCNFEVIDLAKVPDSRTKGREKGHMPGPTVANELMIGRSK